MGWTNEGWDIAQNPPFGLPAWPGNPTAAIQNAFYIPPPGSGDDAVAINAVTLAASNAIGRATVIFPSATWLTATTVNFYDNTRYEFAVGARIKYSGAGDACLIGNAKNIILDAFTVDLTAAGTNAIGLHVKGLWFGEFRQPKVIFAAAANSQSGIVIETAINAAVLDWGSFVIRIIEPDLQTGAGAYGIRGIRSAGGANQITHFVLEDGWVSGKGYGVNLDRVTSFRIVGTAADTGANDGFFFSNCGQGWIQPGEMSGYTGYGINFGAGNSGLKVVFPDHVGPGGTAGYMNTSTYSPDILDQGELKLFGSSSDQTYFFDLVSQFSYGQSLVLKVNGGGSQATILEYGDAAGLTLRGSPNTSPAKKMTLDGPTFGRWGYQFPTEAVLVSGIDATAGEFVLPLALTAARLVGAPLNPAAGQRLTFTLLQDGTGGRAVTWNAVFKVSWSDGGNTLNKRSTISFWYDGTNWNQIGAQTPYV